MKLIVKVTIILFSIFILGSSNTIAQDASFTVDWNPCELQISGSNYYVYYGIYDETIDEFVVLPHWYSIYFSQTYDSGLIETSDWDCNQSESKPYLKVVVYVELRDQNGNVYCTGTGQSALLTCSQFYDNTAIVTVNMEQ